MKLNRDKLFNIIFWSWFAAILLLTWVFVMCGCLGRGCGFFGGIISWLVLTAGPAGVVCGLKYLANSGNGKWYWLLSLCALSAGCVWILSTLFGALCAICPFDVWQQERTVFWDWFLMEYHGDLAETARKMTAYAVFNRILRLNRFIVMKYEICSFCGLLAGWILTVLFSLLFLLRWKGRRFARTCCAGLSAGLLLVGIGFFNWVFAEKNLYRLNVIAREQQKCMKEMQKIRPVVPPGKIRELVKAHARKKTFSDPYWILLRKIEGKKD